MVEKLVPKRIVDLCQYSFFIPAYQRGYRWTSEEVNDLLDDINDFSPRQIDNSDDKTWYCLQPIVVKHKINNEYEVIDGQQRLTTIFLVLHYINRLYVPEGRIKLFEITHQTRAETSSFLNSLGTENEDDGCSDRYADFHYIAQAYSTIKDWYKKRGDTFDRSDFESKFKKHTKVIWYESNEEDTISVFTRLNSGKIKLENAELIKALFLNSSNFRHIATSKERIYIKKKQMEIATEWDAIENSLNNDRFWCFITRSVSKSNRIELIFDIMSKKSSVTDDENHTFRYFYDIFKDKTADIVDHNWSEVRNCFQRLNEWYNERNLYHKIGYLICVEQVTIRDLLDEAPRLTKKEFGDYLDTQIKESLRGVIISELDVGDGKKVKGVLLLYNILTMLQNESDDSKFPFDIYKNNKWDIEHITAVKEQRPEKKEMKQWLSDARPYIDMGKDNNGELVSRIEAFTSNDSNFSESIFESLYDDVILHFGENLVEEDINHISNLALLDAKTNRAYGNAVFPVKRKTIIERDKNGTFIPICTKNVFLKYFADYPPKISFWAADDREKYMQDIEATLKEYRE